MKKVLIILGVIALIVYLLVSTFYFRNKSDETECTSFEVVVKDSSDIEFVTAQEIEKYINRKKLNPIGKRFGDINTLAIQDSILTNKMVRQAEVFTTTSGKIVANIYQRKPVLRVISDAHGDFYVDENREVMPTSSNYSVYLPVATGAISKELAQSDLYDFALFLSKHPEWDAWFEQIVVAPNGVVQLIPRIGDFRITLGELDDYPKKLAKFTRFINEGLNVVGWNRYSDINLRYENQVVCTRK